MENKDPKTLAEQAVELLDQAFESEEIDKESPYWGNPEKFLEDQGYVLERRADKEDTIYGKPRYQETNVRYVFADGSIANEEFEKTWENEADLDEYHIGNAEMAYEQQIADFNAGDSGFVDPNSSHERMKSWEQHQQLKGRPTTSHATSFDDPMPDTDISTDPSIEI